MFKGKLPSYFRSESGATLVEYGVALVVVIVVGAASIGILADTVASEITDTASAF